MNLKARRSLLNGSGTENVYDLSNEMKDVMFSDVGVYRNGSAMEGAIDKIMELKEKDFQGLRGFERVSSIRGLKKILGELIVIVLFVHFFRLAIEGDTFDWTILVIPAGALLMAGALRLLRLGDEDK